MKYDFTTQVSRKNTGSSKWDGMYAANPNVPEGTVPFSVADMEFKNPPQIAEGIGEYLKNSIMGYTFATDAYYDAVIGWMKRRHNWDIKKKWIVEYPGVVPALYHMVNLFTDPGDGVLLFTPVYYPFYNAVRKGGRTLAESRLLLTGRSTMRSILLTLKKKQKIQRTNFCYYAALTIRAWPCMDQRRTG